MDKTYILSEAMAFLYPLTLYLKIQRSMIKGWKLEEGSYSAYKEQVFPYFHLFKQ